MPPRENTTPLPRETPNVPVSSGDRLLVQVIGRDGVLRSGFVSHREASTTGFAYEKYIYDSTAVFQQRMMKWYLFPYEQPTIQFYENNINPVSKIVEDSFMTPDEVKHAVHRGSTIIAKLWQQKDPLKGLIILLIILCIGTLIAAGAAAYFGYQNQKTLNSIEGTLSGLAGSVTPVEDNTVSVPHNTAAPTPFQTPTPVVIKPLPTA